jgi:hypothetical protein
VTDDDEYVRKLKIARRDGMLFNLYCHALQAVIVAQPSLDTKHMAKRASDIAIAAREKCTGAEW